MLFRNSSSQGPLSAPFLRVSLSTQYSVLNTAVQQIFTILGYKIILVYTLQLRIRPSDDLQAARTVRNMSAQEIRS